MPISRFPEERHLIPRSELTEHVSIASLQAVSAQLPGLESWQRATLHKRPISIFDLNGKLLFLDYPVVLGRETVGRVRGAASKVLGSPVISLLREGVTWDYAQSVEKLNARVKKEYRDWKVLETKLVCYSYPKLGVMYNLVDPRGEKARLVFDVVSLNQIPEATPDSSGREGAYAWSFYDSLQDEQRAERMDQFTKIDQARLQAPANTRKLMVASRSLASINTAIIDQLQLWRTTTRQLQFCSHYLHTEARSHHCFILHGQQVDDYCAVATCQMILCYYRYYYTQDQIAPALNYSAGSGCPSDQSAGYESLSSNHIDATYDTSPTFAEAENQINALHPFKSGIPGHARACAGFSSTSWYNVITSRSLYIYDPWPWNADLKAGGAVYWEDWGAVTRTNCVYTRLIY
jgi:hypothetical protein